MAEPIRPKSEQEKGAINDAPVYNDAPPAFDDTTVLENEDGNVINYKTLSWWQGGIVLIAETVSLGILSLPSVVATLGLVPGIIMILIMGVMSTYSGLMLGEFRKQYPFVQNFGDAVELIGRSVGMGPLFQEVFGWGQVIFQVFIMGGHILTWTICLNTLTNSSTCTVVWAVVGLVVFWLCNLPRTLKYTSFMSIASCLSITTAVLITVIDVGIERPIGDGRIHVAQQLSFTSGFLSVCNIAIAFSSHSCFFAVISEFKKPEDWPKALALLQIFDLSLYLVTAIVIYVYVGPDVPSPALSAAGSGVVRKIIWGIAIPTIVIAGVVYGHVAASYVFSRLFRDTKHMIRRTKLSTFAWFGVTFGMWTIAMVIAESIPVFNNLLALIGALFVSWFSYGLPGIFWLWMNWGNWFRDGKQIAHFCGNAFLFLIGLLVCVLGLWATIVAIIETGTEQLPWTCQSNAAP